MAPRSNQEAGSSRLATSIPSGGDSQVSAGDGLDEESVVKICKQCMLSSSGDEVVCPSCGSPLVPIRSVRESYVGETIDGTYRLVRTIGSGGMGTVYLGVDDERDERVAVKFLAKKYAANEQIIMRFLNEARSYGRVTHPNAVTLKEYGQHEDGALYLITEFVDGEPLSDAVQGAGPLTPGAAISVAGQVCGVLSAAHREGVIHRDLKPDNIMLVEDGNGQYHAKVLDFGIAKIVDDERATLTQTGAVFGTPEFMSPEQARGDVADERADIYALGLILFYACTGSRPFDSQNQYKLLDMQQHQPPPRPSDVSEGIDVPAPLERVILTCLEKDPADRYDSAVDLRVELERVAERLNTGPVTVDEDDAPTSLDQTDVESMAPGTDSQGEDTLFLRPFELARRANVDSVDEDSAERMRREADDAGHRQFEAAGESSSPSEPGVADAFKGAGAADVRGRREPGGSLGTDLQVPEDKSDRDSESNSAELRGQTGPQRGPLDRLGAGVADIGERAKEGIVGIFEEESGDRTEDNDRRWSMEWETPNWQDAADEVERRGRRAASSVGRLWGESLGALNSGHAPLVLGACVVVAGLVFGWTQLDSTGSGGSPGSSPMVVTEDRSSEAENRATGAREQSAGPLSEAASIIESGELDRAAQMLKGMSTGGERGQGGQKPDAVDGKKRRALLRRIGRLRRLESSLRRSLDEQACGRARRTLQAIGESSTGLKATLESDVEECESMAPAPEPTVGHKNETDTEAPSDREPEPAAEAAPGDGTATTSTQAQDSGAAAQGAETPEKPDGEVGSDDSAGETPESEQASNDDGGTASEKPTSEATGGPSTQGGGRPGESADKETAAQSSGETESPAAQPEDNRESQGGSDGQEGASQADDDAEKGMALPPKQM